MSRVITADGRRILFDGPETDAQTFVVNNFPRMHIEPGVSGARPDVYVDTDGNKSFYYGEKFLTESELDDVLSKQDETGVSKVTASQLLASMDVSEREQFFAALREELAAHDATVTGSVDPPAPTAGQVPEVQNIEHGTE